MPKTSLDIITQALRLIGVVDVGEVPPADYHAHAKPLLESEFANVKEIQGFAWAWTIETVPDELFAAFAEMLASLIAPTYGVGGPSYARAVFKMRAYSFPNDVENSQDTDGDGTVSASEEQASKRAAFF